MQYIVMDDRANVLYYTKQQNPKIQKSCISDQMLRRELELE